MECYAHAKLNLALDIKGRREDGYHFIDTVMQQITLRDRVLVELASSIQVTCEGVAPRDNTVTKAAKLFFQAVGLNEGARIHIEKHIPMGAGLGGGSSDAAAVLTALNDMYGHPFSQKQLSDVAVRVGADVPFFLRGATQRANGIGEVLSAVSDNTQFSYLLVKPDQSIDTAEAYAVYDELPKQTVDIDKVIRALQTADKEAYFESAKNVFLPAAMRLVPTIRHVGERCLAQGAVFWQLTGSGSCVFAVFDDLDLRERARHALSGDYPFVCCASRLS